MKALKCLLKDLFVMFILACIALTFLSFLDYWKIDRAAYFAAGTVYSAVGSVLVDATRRWRE